MKTRKTSTATKNLMGIVLGAQIFGWLAIFHAACLFSSECRSIRRELRAEGKQIDPVEKILDRLEVIARG
jgi:hypothetical protein